MAARTQQTEAVVLRSIRFGEADRVLHLYSREHGRLGAVAKGVRKTKSRFGARLEPLSHVVLQFHRGSGELGTITGVDLVRAHARAREQPYRLGAALVGAEAVLRLFDEQQSNPRAFEALTRFLDLADGLAVGTASRPALDPLALSFQLKLLWLAGYLPHVTGCADCGAAGGLVGYSPRAGGAVCSTCAGDETMRLAPETLGGIEALLRAPLADAPALGERAARETLAVIAASYEYHGGFRLRTLSA